MPPSNVTVCIRLRPFLPREKKQAVVHVRGNTVDIQIDVEQLYGAQVEQRQFVFDRCLTSTMGQDLLYEQVGEPILENVLEGFSGTLFAYGQTGSGKSHSIMGPDSDPGIIPQLARQLFDMAERDPRPNPASEMRIQMSFLEIYNEELKDLLDPRPRSKKLYVHQHPKLGVYVPHLTEAATDSVSDCMRLLDFGAKIRATAQTNMNSTSSRSHSVLTLRVAQVFSNGKIRNSSVNLCDLAGSERVKKSGAQGQRMREGASINGSLSVLGQVISKLASGADKKGVHVPYRQSKLTHLLMDALSGNSVTTMLANVSPAQSEADESMGTLRFAESVKKVRTKPQVFELAPEEPAQLMESLNLQIKLLQSALEKERTSAPGRGVARAIDSSQDLMQSLAKRVGTSWGEAVEETQALKVVQQKLLEDMSLSVEEVGQLAGVGAGTPYLLNISDDPSLSGCLLYFLRSDPELTTVGQSGAGSIAPNSIMLRGLGIPAKLCEIRYSPGSKAVVRKVSADAEKGRLVVNGRPLDTGVCVNLQHGDRLIFGWAFCFRLVMGSSDQRTRSDSFDSVSTELLRYSMTSSMGSMSIIRATTQWQAEMQRRGVPDDQAEQVLSIVGEQMVLVEEANALCSEMRDAIPTILHVELDIGLTFSFLHSAWPPTVVVHVLQQPEGRMLAVWPADDFDCRLNGLRDAHREALQQGVGKRWAFRLSCVEWWAGQVKPLREIAAPAASDEESNSEADESFTALVSP